MANPPDRSLSGHYRFALKLLISTILLGYLLTRTDLHAISSLLRSLHLPILFASFLLYLLAQVLSALRWRYLLKAERIKLSLWRLILLYFEGSFFSLMLPTLIGGDVVRGYQIFRFTQRHEASVASILVERLSGYAAMNVIACLALVFAYPHLRDPALIWLTMASMVGLAAITAGLLNIRLRSLLDKVLHAAGLGRFHDTFQRLYQAIQRYWTHRRALLIALGLSLLLQSVVILVFYLISRSLNLAVPLGYFFLFVPLISLISMVPVSVAGLGVREGSAIYLFAKVGLDSAGALSLSLLWFTVTALCHGLGGIVFLLGHPDRGARLEARG
jgi:uncharacterized protein (TIRG00374 family)